MFHLKVKLGLGDLVQGESALGSRAHSSPWRKRFGSGVTLSNVSLRSRQIRDRKYEYLSFGKVERKANTFLCR